MELSIPLASMQWRGPLMQYLLYFFLLHRTRLLGVLFGLALLCAALLVWMNDIHMAQNGKSQPDTGLSLVPISTAKQQGILLNSLPNVSVDIAGLIHREADRAGITIEEISYESRLEHDFPIELRNASFSLSNNYMTIRQYLDSVVHAQSNLTLDTLDCTRDDISSPEINCVITLSALQRFSPTPARSMHDH